MIKAEILKLNLPAVILALVGALAFAAAGTTRISYAQAAFIVLGVIAVTSEYQGRQIQVTLTTTPRRIPLYLSKMAALLIIAAPAAAVVARTSDGTIHLVLITLISASVATVVRRTIPAIAVLLVYYFIISPLTQLQLPETIAAAAGMGIATALFRFRDA